MICASIISQVSIVFLKTKFNIKMKNMIKGPHISIIKSYVYILYKMLCQRVDIWWWKGIQCFGFCRKIYK